MVIALGRVLAGWAAGVIAGGAGVKGFAGGEQFVAELNLECAEFVAGTKGTREGFPRDGLHT
jgi:hypothetical protein